MKRTLTIAAHELRLIFMDRGTLINLFLISVVMTIVVGFATGALSTGGGSPVVRVDVLDQDESALSAQFLDYLREANASLVLCPMDNDAGDICNLDDEPLDTQQARRRLENQTTLGLLIIPEGFSEDLFNGEDASVIFRASADASAPTFIQQAVETAVQRINGAFIAARTSDDIAPSGVGTDALSAAVYERAQETWSQEPVQINLVQTNTDEDEGPSFTQAGFGQSVPGMGSMYVMFVIFPVIGTLIRERENWTLQRLVVSPASKAEIMGGKVLARFVLGMIQYTVVFVVGLIIGVNYGSSPLALALVMASFVLCITALALALATFMKTEAQADGVALLLTLTLAPLGGAWWPLEIVPEFMRQVGHISPLAWAMDGYTDLIFFNGGVMDVLPEVAVLMGAALVFFVIGAIRFRYD
ncbi:MAG: ABC transporter permease [Chloroflexi bacterium]|nr:ABC transporter permease [Chloroflexota bacterium]